MKIKQTTAAVLERINQPLVVSEISLPSSLTYGQVLVQIHYSGICGAQINEMEGAKGPDKFLPHLLGHEGSGTVIDIGPGVKSVAVNDRVVLHWRPSNGIQSETPSYERAGEKINAGWVTTFQKHAVVSENRLTKIPNDMDMKHAPLFGCAVTTAMGVVNNDAAVKIGQSVVIFGVGGVGLNIAQAANMVSAYPIIGVDIIDKKLEMAKKFGLSHAFNSFSLEDIETSILNVVGKNGADVVIDTTGSSKVIEMAYNLTHADGKTILVGVPRKGDNINIYSLPLHFKKVLTGSHGGSSTPHIDIPRYINLIKHGKMSLEGIVTHEFPLEKVNDAMDLVKNGGAGRIVLNMGSFNGT